ncbi:hypothetical protein DLAC_01367 [Tieghemostelium lacteum]|uniref:IPT/TIG domain-containing protein n=1 Tax=Tieghemostelium lacteum TaxID=361077 RepID=A0A152A8I6_TIELA|nr:hypothetical protein DLAC_01367 [Tieghemostelium lacteum]|eukprot:KYR02523.1 hypothetical protein DLAC_01367 [Tieghemostelium lacteum]
MYKIIYFFIFVLVNIQCFIKINISAAETPNILSVSQLITFNGNSQLLVKYDGIINNFSRATINFNGIKTIVPIDDNNSMIVPISDHFMNDYIYFELPANTTSNRYIVQLTPFISNINGESFNDKGGPITIQGQFLNRMRYNDTFTDLSIKNHLNNTICDSIVFSDNSIICDHFPIELPGNLTVIVTIDSKESNVYSNKVKFITFDKSQEKENRKWIIPLIVLSCTFIIIWIFFSDNLFILIVKKFSKNVHDNDDLESDLNLKTQQQQQVNQYILDLITPHPSNSNLSLHLQKSQSENITIPENQLSTC